MYLFSYGCRVWQGMYTIQGKTSYTLLHLCRSQLRSHWKCTLIRLAKAHHHISTYRGLIHLLTCSLQEHSYATLDLILPKKINFRNLWWIQSNIRSHLVSWPVGEAPSEAAFFQFWGSYWTCQSNCSLVPSPHPARRGSGDIWLIPRASLKIHSLLYA